ncbi:WD repeat-containing protein 27, partial [Desmophyllum pertusum]
MPTTNKKGENTSEVLSQRFSRSVGLSSHGNQDEELSAIRGAEMATNTITVLSREYPIDSEAPTNLHDKIPLTEQPTSINSVVFAGDGKHIACALANRSAYMLRPPPSSKERQCLLAAVIHRFLDVTNRHSVVLWLHKSIEVFDMNAARTIRVALDAHTRPAHTICQNE